MLPPETRRRFSSSGSCRPDALGKPRLRSIPSGRFLRLPATHKEQHDPQRGIAQCTGDTDARRPATDDAEITLQNCIGGYATRVVDRGQRELAAADQPDALRRADGGAASISATFCWEVPAISSCR